MIFAKSTMAYSLSRSQSKIIFQNIIYFDNVIIFANEFNYRGCEKMSKKME